MFWSKKISSQNLDSLSKEEKEALLKKLRNRVDFFDKILVYVLNKRTKAAVLIGRIKIALNQPTYNPEREREVMQKIYKSNKGPLNDESLERIYERILDESRATQKSESPKLKMDTERKISLGKLLSRKEFLFITIVFLAVLSLLIYTFFTPNYYKGMSPVRFEIHSGQTLNQVIDSLYDFGIIPGKTNMKIAAFLYGAEKNIKAGRYYIPNGLSYVELAELFVYGTPESKVEMIIPMGITLKRFARIVGEKYDTDSASIMELSTNKDYIKSLGYSANSLEGYLMPDSYSFYKDVSPESIIKSISTKFNEFFVDSLQKRIKEMKYNLHEILTVASIVDGESNKFEEFPIIAGVYYNRLKAGMKLQADPTVQYSYETKWRRLYNKDYKLNNPYNTYLHFGLPPGPINNPGKEAILAALYPAEHNYLFFVADGKGGHKFASSYSQHLKLVKEYRKWRDAEMLRLQKESSVSH